MRKIFKTFFILVFLLILVAVVGLFLVVKFVDPTVLKDQFTKQVYRQTGYEVQVNGDLSWRFYPGFGIRLEDVLVASPQGFGKQPLLLAKSIGVDAKIMPLIRGKVAIGAVQLNEPSLYLVKNSQGKVNWESTPPKDVEKSKDEATVAKSSKVEEKVADNGADATAASQELASSNKTSFSIEQINIMNGKLIFDDQKAKKYYSITEWQLETSGIENVAKFPVNTEFRLQSNDPQINEKIALKADVALNLDDEKLGLTIANVHVGPSRASGDLDLQNFAKPKLEGNLAFNTLQLDKLSFSDVSTHFNLKDDVLRVDPLNANIFSGKVTNRLTQNLKQNRYDLFSNAENVNLETLLTALTGKAKITGQLDYTANIKTSGSVDRDIRRNMNGDLKLNLQNGLLKGIDLEEMVNIAVELFQKLTPRIESKSDRSTPIEIMSMTARIRGGVLETDDLLLKTPTMEVTGEGSTDLVSEKLKFRLRVYVKRSDADEDVLQLQRLADGIPLTVSGTWDSPKVWPDERIITDLVAKKVLEGVQEKVQEGAEEIQKSILRILQ